MKRRVCKHCAREYVAEIGNKGFCSLLCRFWHKVRKSDDADGCWEWMASKFRGGYGKIRVNGKMHLAHRVSYEMHHGTIPTGEGYHGTCVLHQCDNPGCVNPAHLFLGSNQDNMTDKVQKGRQVTPKGEAHGRSVLTQVQVDQIRETYGNGGVTQIQLGREYGVHNSQISYIVNRKRWK